MNFDALVLGPQYRVFGVDAQLDLGGDVKSLRVIDRTAKFEAGTDVVRVDTTKPRVACRKSDLDALGVQLDTLRDATLTLNGNTWTITSTSPDMGPNGKGTGEIILNLRNGDL